MNILLVNWTWYPSGGDWIYIDSIRKIYEGRGHNIIPFSMANEKNFPTPYDKYFIKEINYKELNRNKSIRAGLRVISQSIYSFEAKRKLEWLLLENKIDIAQLNSINNYHTPSIIPVLKKKKIPVVWRILDYKLICPNTTFVSNGSVCEACYKHRYYNCVFKKCKKNSFSASLIAAFESYFYYLLRFYNQIDMFLFQSEFTRDIFIKYGFDIKKTHIIENPYDFRNVKPSYKGKKYILYFGRLERLKGIYTLLDAVKRTPEIELIIVGNEPEYGNCTQYIKKEAISNATMVGPKWNDQLTPILKDSRFVIVPSEWYEPSPYVILQSFAFGKPVIASEIGGIKDLVKNNENGILFKAGDSEELARYIRTLWQDEKTIRRMGQSGRKTLEILCNPAHYYNDTIQIFSRLIDSGTK